MKIQRFEDSIAWQKTRELVNLSYKELQGCRDFTFRDQFLRASLSVMNNIAEGFERQSDKEMKQFLFISKGSCAEVRSMLYVGEEREFVSPNS